MVAVTTIVRDGKVLHRRLSPNGVWVWVTAAEKDDMMTIDPKRRHTSIRRDNPPRRHYRLGGRP